MISTIDERAMEFVKALSELRFRNAFNPYSDECPENDEQDAAGVRRRNLELVLDAALRSEIDSIWIARDLGYRGGRRTGLALTDEIHLTAVAEFMGTPPLARATKGPPVSERTAAIVWRMIRVVERPVFLWNAFPLHPHKPDDPLSNRCHTRVERAECRPLLFWLLETLRPKRIVAIGRDAHAALTEMNIRAVYVRHPSYGGQADFMRGMAKQYDAPRANTSGDAQTSLEL
jgi:hypothetical protein